MTYPYESFGSQETRSAVMQLCDIQFEAARNKTVLEGGVHVGIFTNRSKETYEYVALLDPEGTKSLAYLCRHLDDSPEAQKFPYILLCYDVGIDQETKLKETIRSEFYIDPKGSFNTIQGIDHRTVHVVPQYARSGLLEILGSSEVCEIPAFYE